MTIALARPWLAAALLLLPPAAWAQDDPTPRPRRTPASRPKAAPPATAQPTEEPADDADAVSVESRDEDEAQREEDERPRKRRRRHHGKGGDVSLGQSVHIEAGQKNDDDIVVMGSTARIDGRQDGDVVVLGGTAKISGEVDGNVVVVGGGLELESTAHIDGDAVSVGGYMKKEAGAVVTGQTVDMGAIGMLPGLVPDWHWKWGLGLGSIFFMPALAWLKTAAIALLLSLLIAVVMPTRIEAAGVALRDRWFESLGMGLVTGILCVIATPLFCLTCIGAPLPYLFFQVAKYFGMAALFIVVGQSIGRAGVSRDLSPFPSLLAGFLPLALLALFLPVMWWVYAFVAVGCAMITKFGAMRPWFPPKAPSTPPSPPMAIPPADEAIV